MANPEEIELAEENVQKDEEDTPKKISSTSEDNNDPELSEEIDLDVSDNLLRCGQLWLVQHLGTPRRGELPGTHDALGLPPYVAGVLASRV